MASGGALVPRPHNVPIGDAHGQIRDNVRRTPPASLWVPPGWRVEFRGAVTSAPSVGHFLPYGHVIDGLELAAGTAGGADSVITVYLDGVSAFMLTIPSGSTDVVSILGQNVGLYKQKVSLVATTIGSGLADVGGQLRFMAIP